MIHPCPQESDKPGYALKLCVAQIQVLAELNSRSTTQLHLQQTYLEPLLKPALSGQRISNSITLDLIVAHLHAICSWLSSRGFIIIVLMEQEMKKLLLIL